MTPDNDVLEQAADWHLWLQQEPQSRPAFEAWLQVSPEHQRAWRRMEKMWGALAELSVPAAAAKPVAQTVRRRPRRLWPAVLMAASVAALAVLVAPRAQLALRADYYTGVGETRAVHLVDGSVITLAPQSALSLASNDSRQVTLLQGQAFFQVAHDPQHPFVAHAGQLSVRVLGTAFDLDLQADSAEVALEQGQVQAENATPPVSERLLPGQRLKLNWPSGAVERSQIDPAQIGVWRSGSLFVEDQTVAAIVDHLQRYTPGWIVVRDPALNQKRITGVFDLNNPQKALNALAQSLAVKSRTVTPWVHVLGDF